MNNDFLSGEVVNNENIIKIKLVFGFGLKSCLFFSGLRWKYFNSLGTEEGEPINLFDDKYMRWFVRQCIKGGRVSKLKIKSL